MEETLYNYWLMNINGIGPATLERLFTLVNSAQELWDMTESELSAPEIGLNKTQVSAILSSRNEDFICSSYKKLSEKGITFIPQSDHRYPESLKIVSHPPKALYLKGKLPDPAKISVAIVGARTCSEYGRYVTRKISEYLAAKGFQIISGLALGIDVISQKSALDAGGYSCGVLGCGVDICYPVENKETYNRLIQSGGIISEYPPGTAPKASFFPMRNRIISALADIVVVIEAREKSGSLITADLALEQGKEIYALPGRVTDSLSHGCNRLIRQGAGIILSPEEFVNDLAVNYSICKDFPSKEQNTLPEGFPVSVPADLSEAEKTVLKLIDFNPVNVSQLQILSGLSFPNLMDTLMSLSIKGLVSQNGSYYSLISH